VKHGGLPLGKCGRQCSDRYSVTREGRRFLSGSSDGPFRFHLKVAEVSPVVHEMMNWRPAKTPKGWASAGTAVGDGVSNLLPINLTSFAKSDEASVIVRFSA
jgi:hypothetical protein